MIIYIVISFFLENTFGMLFNNNFFIPLFFLITLMTFYQVKDIDKDKYILIMLFSGLFYDIVYTNIYINCLLFPILGYLNIIFKKNINEKVLLYCLFIIIALALYELLFYLLFFLLSFSNLDIVVYLKTLLKIIPINLLYYLISLFILKRLR